MGLVFLIWERGWLKSIKNRMYKSGLWDADSVAGLLLLADEEVPRSCVLIFIVLG